MGNSSNLFDSLFKNSLSSDDLPAHLAQVTKEHPYFSPAQFFLLLQMQAETPAYKLQAAKTSILFNNAFWLNFQLLENDGIVNQPQDGETFVGYAPAAKKDHNALVIDGQSRPQMIEEPNESLNNNDEVENFFNEGTDEAGFVEEPSHADNPDGEFPPVEKDIEISSPLLENSNDVKVEDNSIEGLMGDPIPHRAEEYASVSTEDKHEDGEGKETNDNIEHPGKEVDESLANVGNVSPAAEGRMEEPFILNKEKTEVSHESPEAIKAINTIDTIPKDAGENGVLADPGVMPDEELPLTEDDLNPANNRPLDFKLNLEPSRTTEKEITFEPLHTTDYFASLGIKLSGDIKANDKLGKQLKSFTEWLKTMKKIHTDKLEQSSGQADQVIQTLAEKSNTEDEVLTETMAEVLLQQGKADKAIDVYKKLSLLNPSKNAYFAAKIDQLKQ